MDELVTARIALDDGIRAQRRGDHAAADQLLRASLQTFVMRGESANACAAYVHLGELHRNMGRTVEAFADFEKAGQHAVSLLWQANDLLANSLLGRGVICLQGGRLLESYLLLMHALSLFQEIASPRSEEVKRLVGQIQTQVGPQQAASFDQCWRQYQQALNQAQQSRQGAVTINLGA